MQTSNLHEKSQVIFNYIVDRFGMNAADVLVCEPPNQTLKYLGGRGFVYPNSEKSLVHAALAGEVVQAGRMVQLDLEKKKKELKLADDLLAEGFKMYIGLPLMADNQLAGVLEIFHRDYLALDAAWFAELDGIAESSAFALRDGLLTRHLRAERDDLALAYEQTIEGWARVLELRDYEPKGHNRRVTETTVDFARILGIAEPELSYIRRGAMLHDVGMMAIPDRILLKSETESLTDEDWVLMRRHPLLAFEQLSTIEFLKPSLEIPRYHHEKWDGTGYPDGLAGDKIPLSARIFALVDVWDSLSSDRPFRKAWPKEKILAHLRDRGGKQFEQNLADLFVKLVDQGLKRNNFAADGIVRSYQETNFTV
jgi:response regulator RpfG family c-di-GMP phosphodiesterase